MGQLGAAADSNGAKTTPETAQQIIAAQYVNARLSPVVGGGQVTGTSTLAYHVTAGVGLVQTAAGAVYAAWAETDTALTAPPETGTATDVIYVDADGLVHIARDGDQPAGVCVLDKRTITAGAAATTATTSGWKRIWAETYGSSQGTLAFFREPASNDQLAATTYTFNLWFTTTTARDVTYTICQQLRTDSVGELNPAAIQWTIIVDGTEYAKFELMATRLRTVAMKDTFHPSLPAGSHHIQFVRRTVWPSNARVLHFGIGDGFEGGYLRVNDEGIAG